MLRPARRVPTRQERMEGLEAELEMDYEDVVAELAALAPHATLSTGASAIHVAWLMGRRHLRLPSAAVFGACVDTHDEEGRPTVMALEDHLLLLVFAQLDFHGLVRIGMTCRRFRALWQDESLHRRHFERRGANPRLMYSSLFATHDRPWFEASQRAEAWRRVCDRRPPVPGPGYQQPKNIMRVRVSEFAAVGHPCTFCRKGAAEVRQPAIALPWALCCMECWCSEGFHWPVALGQKLYAIGHRDDKSLLKGRRFHKPVLTGRDLFRVAGRPMRVLGEDVRAQSAVKFGGDLVLAMDTAIRFTERRLRERSKRPRVADTDRLNKEDQLVLRLARAQRENFRAAKRPRLEL